MRRSSLNNDEGQLLLIGGVLITFLILAMAAISISISDINKPVYKKDFILQDYANIREEFGRTLNCKMQDKLIDITSVADADTICRPYFYDAKEMFVFTAKTEGNFFNAEYLEPFFNSDSSLKGLKVRLTFSNEKESISEVVIYEFA